MGDTDGAIGDTEGATVGGTEGASVGETGSVVSSGVSLSWFIFNVPVVCSLICCK